jgi:dienelactone hydrolase
MVMQIHLFRQKMYKLLKKSMDSVGAHYTFKAYPGALHAFTNPGANRTWKEI